MTDEVNFKSLELRSIKGVSRELAWRIEANNPYKHQFAKPHIIQEELQRVRGVGPQRAGQIYRKLVKVEEATQV